MELSELIRIKRELKGYSREALGLMVGYRSRLTARNSVALWETGGKPVPLEKIRKVSEILEIPLVRFIP